MAFLAPVCLALLLLVQTSAASSANSITYDETFYAGCGEDTALRRRLHPMLLSAGTAPLPVLACYVGPALLMRKMPRANCWHAARTIDGWSARRGWPTPSSAASR